MARITMDKQDGRKGWGEADRRRSTVVLDETTIDITEGSPKYLINRVKIHQPKPMRSMATEYGIAIGTTLLAFLLRLSIDSYLGDALPFITFIIGIAVTTWYGRVGASLTAVFLGALVYNWYFVSPRYEFTLTGPVDQAGMAVYLTVSFAIVGFVQIWRWAWRRTEEMAEELLNEVNREHQTEEKPILVGSTESQLVSQRES